MNVFNPLFNIVIACKPKRISKPKTNKISRKCLAVVTKVDGEFKAIINYTKSVLDITDTFSLKNEVLIIPFTENSLSLKGKEYVWLKHKDKYNHNICIIRDYNKSTINPSIPEQYDPLREDSLIVGHIIKENGIMYFNYEDLVSYNYKSESKIIDVKIDDSKPLFNK